MPGTGGDDLADPGRFAPCLTLQIKTNETHSEDMTRMESLLQLLLDIRNLGDSATLDR